jgi:hypothetical protein
MKPSPKNDRGDESPEHPAKLVVRTMGVPGVLAVAWLIAGIVHLLYYGVDTHWLPWEFTFAVACLAFTAAGFAIVLRHRLGLGPLTIQEVRWLLAAPREQRKARLVSYFLGFVAIGVISIALAIVFAVISAIT